MAAFGYADILKYIWKNGKFTNKFDKSENKICLLKSLFDLSYHNFRISCRQENPDP